MSLNSMNFAIRTKCVSKKQLALALKRRSTSIDSKLKQSLSIESKSKDQYIKRLENQVRDLEKENKNLRFEVKQLKDKSNKHKQSKREAAREESDPKIFKKNKRKKKSKIYVGDDLQKVKSKNELRRKRDKQAQKNGSNVRQKLEKIIDENLGDKKSRDSKLKHPDTNKCTQKSTYNPLPYQEEDSKNFISLKNPKNSLIAYSPLSNSHSTQSFNNNSQNDQQAIVLNSSKEGIQFTVSEIEETKKEQKEVQELIFENSNSQNKTPPSTYNQEEDTLSLIYSKTASYIPGTTTIPSVINDKIESEPSIWQKTATNPRGFTSSGQSQKLNGAPVVVEGLSMGGLADEHATTLQSFCVKNDISSISLVAQSTDGNIHKIDLEYDQEICSSPPDPKKYSLDNQYDKNMEPRASSCKRDKKRKLVFEKKLDKKMIESQVIITPSKPELINKRLFEYMLSNNRPPPILLEQFPHNNVSSISTSSIFLTICRLLHLTRQEIS